MSGTGRAWLGVACGVAMGIGCVAALDAADRADAQASKVEVTAEQLLINQRISQAAVRRSNRALDILRPLTAPSPTPGDTNGWRTREIRDGAITERKLSPALRDEAALFASVAATGSLTAGRGVTGSQQLSQGEYVVTFERSVAACAAWVQPVGQNAFVQASSSSVQTDSVLVTTSAAGGDRSDRAFNVMVLCP